jgi:hypothetical protein
MTWKTSACFDSISMHPETDIVAITGQDSDDDEFSDDVDINPNPGSGDALINGNGT